ncbi:type 1 glutamine amidotransferase family protein [Serratia fonticola]|jgi:putative intracellular protease/amidase|uniref:hypothetical protein n=1 Tax=Serratia fonticola TaxID=47917 RepID=UPI00217CAE9F|nr:hypothetical protein [Serratia fonticola]CAI0972364.1 Uncharacterised protein [Serratia fonticola]CAI1060829.1 Uncharacterised protein [Serratia fonticola]CAI1614848.1 Uncharacterised protein [Serratia fonticola]CAI1728296.1 Uncharacterised protein [Serratia fonticola]CAI1768635.1 Uncharacterised protein [Serratia fonticola]
MAQRILFVLTSHDRKGPADALQERGARHLPVADFQVQVVVSERLVTGQNPASAKGVAEAMLPLLVSSAYGRE